MASGLEPRMTANSYVPLQWALMSIVPIALMILLLLLCGFFKRYKKNRTLTMKPDNGNVNKDPTRLIKITQDQQVFIMNGKQMAGDMQNGKSSLTEAQEQTKTATEANSFVVIQKEPENPVPGELRGERGSSDSRRASTNKKGTQQEFTDSFKHRKLPSLPHKEAVAVTGQLNSNGNAEVLLQKHGLEPLETSVYEELHVEKGLSQVVPSNEAIGGLSSQDWKGPVHESGIDVEELWPPAPPVAFSGFPTEDRYADIYNGNASVLAVQPVVPNPLSASKEPFISKQKSVLDATSYGGTAGGVMGGATSEAINLSWRFHLNLTGDMKDSTQTQEPNTKALYSRVKKKSNHTQLLTSPTSKTSIEQDNDVPPPVPVKRFNIEDEMMNQDMEEPLPPPPPPPILAMD